MTCRRPGGGRYRGRYPDGLVSAASPPPATPLTIISSTAVNLWQRADLGAPDSGSGTCVAWADQTANGRNWTQPGAASAGATIVAGGLGGRNYLAFDGGTKYLTNAFVPPGTGFVWMVVRRSATTGFLLNSSSAGSNRFSIGVATGNVTMRNVTSVNSTAMADATWMVLWASFTGTVADELKVGSAAVTAGGASAGTSGGLGGMWLGNRGDLAGPSAYDIAEIFHCAAKPSAGELSSLSTYVAATWGGAVQV